jgi:PhzF family phenazine biosynthesis protein
MNIPIFTVDAFAAERFHGNPAAVCLLTESCDEHWMQYVAREMNLSETAFVVPQTDGYGIRWFTPRVEVALCGHATLASAHILWETERVPAGKPITFTSRSGPLGAKRDGHWIELDFPARVEKPAPPPPHLAEALGAKLEYVGRNVDDFLVVVDCEKTVRNLKPNFAQLRELNVRGVIVTAAANGGDFDFVSRFFAPGAGIDEDPVTGSAHCCLGPYWQMRLNKNEFIAYQASERGGMVKVRVAGDRVLLGGQAITVVSGAITK